MYLMFLEERIKEMKSRALPNYTCGKVIGRIGEKIPFAWHVKIIYGEPLPSS